MLALLLPLILVSGIPEREKNGMPHLRSETVLIRYADTKEIILKKLPNKVRPIASVTKLLSGLILTELQVTSSTKAVTITERDKDRLKWSRSRLNVGYTFQQKDLYDATLVASDNRAMYALVRSTGLTRCAFVKKMNRRARKLGMKDSAFVDPAGIDPDNRSTARDLLLLIEAVAANEIVRKRTATPRIEVELLNSKQPKSKVLRLTNPNRLARSKRWGLLLGKTGYTVEAGRTLAVRVMINKRSVDMVFLGSREMMSVFGDAGRVRRWMLDRSQPNAK